MKTSKPSSVPYQFITTLRTHRKAIEFARKHKVWNGFWEYGWVSRALMVVAAILGLKFLGIFTNWLWSSPSESIFGAVHSMGMLLGNFAMEGYQFLFAGSMKYLILILVEVILFHASRTTTRILLDKKSESDFNTFIKAQIRMLKVVLMAFILETVFTSLINALVNHFWMSHFLRPALILGVQCYFLGVVVMDSYFEQFDLTVKESFRYARNYIGVALAIGLVLYVAMLIPFVGSIVGPFIAAITASLVLYKLSDIHVLGRAEIDGVEEYI